MGRTRISKEATKGLRPRLSSFISGRKILRGNFLPSLSIMKAKIGNILPKRQFISIIHLKGRKKAEIYFL
jgi:hypothetical protein